MYSLQAKNGESIVCFEQFVNTIMQLVKLCVTKTHFKWAYTCTFLSTIYVRWDDVCYCFVSIFQL